MDCIGNMVDSVLSWIVEIIKVGLYRLFLKAGLFISELLQTIGLCVYVGNLLGCIVDVFWVVETEQIVSANLQFVCDGSKTVYELECWYIIRFDHDILPYYNNSIINDCQFYDIDTVYTLLHFKSTVLNPWDWCFYVMIL